MSMRSLPGGGFGFLDVSTYDDAQGGGEDDVADLRASDLDVALRTHAADAQALAAKLIERAARSDGEAHPTADLEQLVLDSYGLTGCVFVGHTNTDLDSVASACGAAALFGGVAARSEVEVNGEIDFACRFAGVPLPTQFDQVDDGAVNICLVDHNEPSQMVQSIGSVAFPSPGQESAASAEALARIVGVIDHHAISERFKTPHPIFVDTRPWGSACTIVAHLYVRLGKPMSKPIATLLLCGILSDTLNATSPTTTAADRTMATLLVFFAEVRHPNTLAKSMFKAKTAHFAALSAYSIVRADQKTYSVGRYAVGWATVEVQDPAIVLTKAAELLVELRLLKADKALDFVFLSVVDIAEKRTVLLLCGHLELQLATLVFGGVLSSALDSHENKDHAGAAMCSCTSNVTPAAPDSDSDSDSDSDQVRLQRFLPTSDTLMDLGDRVSRKKEFIPPIKAALCEGFEPAQSEAPEVVPLVKTAHACVQGIGCSIKRSFSFTSESDFDRRVTLAVGP